MKEQLIVLVLVVWIVGLFCGVSTRTYVRTIVGIVGGALVFGGRLIGWAIISVGQLIGLLALVALALVIYLLIRDFRAASRRRCRNDRWPPMPPL